MDKIPERWPDSFWLCDFRQVTALSGPRSEGLTCEGLEQLIRSGLTAGGRGAKPGHICLPSPPCP